MEFCSKAKDLEMVMHHELIEDGVPVAGFYTTNLSALGYTKKQINSLRKHSMNLETESRPEIRIYGRKVKQNRDVQFYSNTSAAYEYSGIKAEAKPLSVKMNNLRIRVNKYFGDRFNGVLVNSYESGERSIGPHGDSQINLGKSGVLCISFGATRKLRIRDKNKKIIVDIPSRDAEVLWMAGVKSQTHFMHEIPKELKVKECRVSLTFRKHKC